MSGHGVSNPTARNDSRRHHHGLEPDTASDKLAPVNAPVATTGRFHLIVDDGLANGTTVTFNGARIGTTQFASTSGSLWDVVSHHVNVPAAQSGLNWTSNARNDCLLYSTVTPDFAIPPTANLAITKTNGVSPGTPGASVSYTSVASNAGPGNAPGSTVTDTLPAALSGATWAAQAAALARQPAVATSGS